MALSWCWLMALPDEPAGLDFEAEGGSKKKSDDDEVQSEETSSTAESIASQAPDSESESRCYDLGEGLSAFRTRALAMQDSERHRTLASAACDLVSGLATGPSSQLPDLSATARLPDDEAADSVCLKVRHSQAIEGEIATRSRIGYSVYMQEETSFILRVHGDEVVLETPGLEFRPLRDAAALRGKLRALLGGAFSKQTAYKWWEAHADEVCPFESSKLRWIIESILGLRSISAVTPQEGRENVLWGFLHARRLRPECFHFWEDERLGVRVVGVAAPPQSEEEAELQVCSDAMIAQVPQRDLTLGEYFMPSSMNWLALFNSDIIGQPGANPGKVAKLLSAAREWGPAEDGWQQQDRSWNCVDQKNFFGRTTLKQGRVIWALARSDED
ncbi:unnamed protein product [Symbiodinium sp. CCMP2592]|nr:unnamed protein product [Symbiodinium sp. CCMP2592]